VQLQFSLTDPSAPNATPEQVLKKLAAAIGSSQLDLGENRSSPENSGSPEPDNESAEHSEPATTGDTAAASDVQEKKRKRILMIANLRKRAKERGYEFINGSPVAGVLFVEVQRITDLPPERNGTSRAKYLARLIA
jgi:phosphatidylserine decarboxylase